MAWWEICPVIGKSKHVILKNCAELNQENKKWETKFVIDYGQHLFCKIPDGWILMMVWWSNHPSKLRIWLDFEICEEGDVTSR